MRLIRFRTTAAVPVIAALATAVALVGAAPVGATKTTTTAKGLKPAKTTPTTSKTRQGPSPTTAIKASPATTVAPLSTLSTTGTLPAKVVLSGSINVFAASSLTASFVDIAAAFEKANPGVKITLNFAGSSTLVTQIHNGAPADVFASADPANMDRLTNAKLVEGTPLVFTRNRPMIVVPRGNPLRIVSLADLARPEVVVALGAVGVPVGDYARRILGRAGIQVKPKTLESSVSAIVTKAALREIDAGIVYATDVAIDEYRVDGVAIPEEQNIVATYPVAALTSSANKATAAGFVAFTQSSVAQAILAKYKFVPLK